MGKLLPVNDYFLVEVIEDQWGVADPEEGVRRGKVVDISKEVAYFGSHTYYFDKSLGDGELLKKTQAFYADYVGKVVYWPERSESGTIIEHEGKKYIFMKWASVMGVEE